jgi:hypothetical protein
MLLLLVNVVSWGGDYRSEMKIFIIRTGGKIDLYLILASRRVQLVSKLKKHANGLLFYLQLGFESIFFSNFACQT